MTDDTTTSSEAQTPDDTFSSDSYDVAPEGFESDIDATEAQVPDKPVIVEVPGKGEAAARLVKQKTLDELREKHVQGDGAVEADILDAETVVKLLKHHYTSPSFEGLTVRKYKNARGGYYDKFLDAIIPELGN